MKNQNNMTNEEILRLTCILEEKTEEYTLLLKKFRSLLAIRKLNAKQEKFLDKVKGESKKKISKKTRKNT